MMKLNKLKFLAVSLVAYIFSVGIIFAIEKDEVDSDTALKTQAAVVSADIVSRYHTQVTTENIQNKDVLDFIGNPFHGHIYLTVIEDEHFIPERDLPKLGVLERLKGLKLGRICDINERVPGLPWYGGVGSGPSLKIFATSLRVLDLGLDSPSGTYKLSAEGSAFLVNFVNLEELNLCNHYITEGATNLAGLVNLRRLNLYNNKIGEAVSVLSSMKRMEVLDLGNNNNMPVDATRDTLLAMVKLKEVDLAFLPVIPAVFDGWFTAQIASVVRKLAPTLGISRNFGVDFQIDYSGRHN